MKTNELYVGNNVDVLKTFEDESVDMCITSPPYYNLRDYKNSGQLGVETTVDLFVSNLCEVFDEVHRVLKPTGSCWVNIGDTYDKKKLSQVPSRFEIAMSDRGWFLRNEIIWNKPNPQPMSVKDKFWPNHEKIFWFVKKLKGYYFDRAPILVPQAEVSLKRMFCSNNLSKRKDIDATEKEGFSLTSKNQDEYFEKMRESIDFDKDFNYQQLIDSGRCPSRPMFTVWDISSHSKYKGAHFAVYPPELIKIPILATCPTEGVVLDPFVGSGTTCVVAKELNRKYVGIDISEEYVKLARDRISTSLDNFFV